MKRQRLLSNDPTEQVPSELAAPTGVEEDYDFNGWLQASGSSQWSKFEEITPALTMQSWSDSVSGNDQTPFGKTIDLFSNKDRQ